MFYLDIWKGILPDWIPFIGGEYYSLWPIFNVADASIFCGIFTILIFQNRFLNSLGKEETSPQVVK
jgi:signal peptidase II